MQIGKDVPNLVELPLNFTSTPNLNNSLDAAYATLNSSTSYIQELAQILLNSAKNNQSYKVQQCNLFNDPSNCKYVLGEIETYSWEDYYTGETMTNSYPKWYSTADFNGLVDYTGTVITQSTTCSATWSPDYDLCPQGTTTDSEDLGSYDVYLGTDTTNNSVRLRLVCADTSSWQTHQDWAYRNTKADSIDDISSKLGCATITDGPFSGEKSLLEMM